MGQLRAKLEPFVEPESARVELVPGSGEVLRFTVAEGKAASVRFRDAVFQRVK
jgi:hypothetical protein